MTAGLSTLSQLNSEMFTAMTKKVDRLTSGIQDIAGKHGVKVQIHHVGTMWSCFFTTNEVNNFEDVKTCDEKYFAKFYHRLLAHRVYTAPSQYESEVVYHNMQNDFEKKGIIFMDMDSAVQQYPELVRQYFDKLVDAGENKMAALNSAVWSGGTPIYTPKRVNIEVAYSKLFSDKCW